MTADPSDGQPDGEAQRTGVEGAGVARHAARRMGQMVATTPPSTPPYQTKPDGLVMKPSGSAANSGPVVDRLMQARPNQPADEAEANDLPGELARFVLAREVALHDDPATTNASDISTPNE